LLLCLLLGGIHISGVEVRPGIKVFGIQRDQSFEFRDGEIGAVLGEVLLGLLGNAV